MGVFIIAEIGINHNGDLSIAKKLIDEAKNAGCNAVKFQKRDINLVYTAEFLNSPRVSPWGKSQRDQKEGLEFEYEDYLEIDAYCKDKQIAWLASAWDIESQRFLKKFDTKYNKIASPMIIFKELLEDVAKEGKHTFISTGMSTYSDIDEAIKIFKKYKCSFELMHAVSTYPLKPEDANLKMINTLRDKYNCNIGYSGHEQNLEISFAATALGITSLERHFTLDQKMYGSDQSSSIEPNLMKELVFGVRNIEKSMGNGIKKILPEEEIIAKKLRQHIIID